MEPKSTVNADHDSKLSIVRCECCDGVHEPRRLKRREFLTTASGLALSAGVLGSVLPSGRVWAQAKSAAESVTVKGSPESMVKVLYEALSPKQREAICFPWDHQDKERGLLRTRVAAQWFGRWRITRSRHNRSGPGCWACTER